MEEERSNPPAGADGATRSGISASTIVATRASSGRFSNPSLGLESTRLLFMGCNFREGRNDQDVFYDCEDWPLMSRSAQTTVSSRCNLDDPSAIRDALERAANATKMLLTNFDKAGGWNTKRAVTLELSARLVDPKKGRTACAMHGKPVTIQMPLEFNAQSGKKSSCQQKKKQTHKAHNCPNNPMAW